MNDKYLKRAMERIPERKILVQVAQLRAKQLARGARPMVKTQDKDFLDVALLEIAEGKIAPEMPVVEETVSAEEN